MSKNVSSQRVSNAPTRDVNAVARVELAIKLRATKMPYEAIAKQCGYGSASACRKAVMRELDRCVVKNVEALRTEEADSLERLEQECWKIFYDKERQKGQLFAVDRILQIKERRARMLGLDTPVDAAMAMNQIIIREVPQGWIAQPVVEASK
jgi:hypothetical protein